MQYSLQVGQLGEADRAAGETGERLARAEQTAEKRKLLIDEMAVEVARLRAGQQETGAELARKPSTGLFNVFPSVNLAPHISYRDGGRPCCRC